MAVLKYPIATEKAVGLVDRGNVIVYAVDMRASKPEIRKEFEASFNVKVAAIRTVNMPQNLKKAYIKVATGYKATEIAGKLKLV